MDQNDAGVSGRRVEPDFFPPGSKVCFLCLAGEDLSASIRTIFESHGYLTTGTSDVEIARQKLRLNQYQVVVIEADPDFRTIFQEINSWPGIQRRNINLVVMGKKAPSLHQQMAFVMGANYYLNINDGPQMEKLIRQVIDGYDEYYLPWNKAREGLDAH
jgi:hypothetical protein